MKHALIATALTTTALVAGTFAPASAGRGDIQDVSTGGTRSGETCRGLPATHVDEDGTAGDDVIVVTDGSVTVNAWNGNDLICVVVTSGYGATVFGGNGDDTIITYSGENFVYGGDDDDSILSNSADHILDGEDGNDNIYLGQDPDVTVYGGDGNDKIFGSPFADTIHAGSGADYVNGFGGDDVLGGGPDNDTLVGGAGFDTLDGHSGTDACTDSAAPATSFASCESIVGTLVQQGPGEFAIG
jgi:Ca2+-binding RTX toxin-like protein